MITKQEVIKSAKTIIKNKTCFGVFCGACPFYYEFNEVNCDYELGSFADNSIYKLSWFKEWLKKAENTQLEFDFNTPT